MQNKQGGMGMTLPPVAFLRVAAREHPGAPDLARQRLAMGRRVIQTPLRIFHSWLFIQNIQSGV
jgi:hypothetical protein